MIPIIRGLTGKWRGKERQNQAGIVFIGRKGLCSYRFR